MENAVSDRNANRNSKQSPVVSPFLPRALWKTLYRVGQFLRGFAAQVRENERRLAGELLPPAARPLFERMPVDAQRHSLDVLYDVQAAGYDNVDLAVAALLHDAGKVRMDEATGKAVCLGLWWRGPLVLVESLAPDWLMRRASADVAHGLRHLLYLHLYHAHVGAAAARAAGCSDLTCRLIEQHQEKIPLGCREDADSARFLELLRILQWADSRN